jgi:hypothetical protein
MGIWGAQGPIVKQANRRKVRTSRRHFSAWTSGQESRLEATLDTMPDPSGSDPEKQSNTTIKLWVHLLSVFVVVSYLQPLQLSENFAVIQGVFDLLSGMLKGFIFVVPSEVWSLIHAVSGMMFGGSILCTAVVEWIWPDELRQMTCNRATSQGGAVSETTIDDLSLQLLLNKMATKTLFPMEGKLVLPGVTGSMISGIAQSFYNYGSLRLAPRHVKSSLHLIFLFGLWWAWTDRKTQNDIILLSSTSPSSKSQNSSQNGEETPIQEEMMEIWKRRRLYNAISCVFVFALYAIMILKPG